MPADSRGGLVNGQVGLQLRGESDLGPHGAQQHRRGSAFAVRAQIPPEPVHLQEVR